MSGRKKRASSYSRGDIGSFLRRPLVQIMTLVIVVIIIYLLAVSGGGSNNREIIAEQAYQKYRAGAFLLDVRTQDEWNEYHVPNTILIPLDQLQIRMNE
ncbi:MAG: rhodanese-like domain-containing protein, partial [Anaerolineales bacterium]|nr:rhodanese-like domain-containing protein [Anaerolineales bacterium]